MLPARPSLLVHNLHSHASSYHTASSSSPWQTWAQLMLPPATSSSYVTVTSDRDIHFLLLYHHRHGRNPMWLTRIFLGSFSFRVRHNPDRYAYSWLLCWLVFLRSWLTTTHTYEAWTSFLFSDWLIVTQSSPVSLQSRFLSCIYTRVGTDQTLSLVWLAIDLFVPWLPLLKLDLLSVARSVFQILDLFHWPKSSTLTNL